MINQIISHYNVLEKLGEGGMGVLYLAEDLQLNRKAVLKFLPPDMINDPDINLRFKREAQSAGSLSHPNIVTIYDVGVHENKTFIAMEYVEGKTLRELLRSDELTIERITDISIQICEGLNEAHSKGITHRDIKPENILIDEKGKVKIVDFGLAKIKDVSRGITKQDSTVGTLKYMSPEQIRNQTVDHRSDIWSFGVILYEMITGKYPFKGEHDASLFYSIINQSPEPLERYKANIGEGFQRIIDKSIDKDPGTRYQHIVELLSDLRREKKESGEHRVGKRRVKKLTTKIPIIFSAIAIVVFGTALIIYMLNKPTKKIPPPKHTQLTFDGNIYFYINVSFLDRSQISPDGQFTTYILNKKNGKSIYVKDNYGEQTIEIYKGLQEVTSLKWSPSGNEILFSAILNDSSRYSYIIPRLGGKVQEFKFFTFGCWSPDENLIAGISSKHIVLIERETGEVIKKIELKGVKSLRDIDWSPIGDNLVFAGLDEKSDNYAIGVIKTNGTQQKKIFETSGILFSPRWSSDGENIYFLQSNGMTKDLMKLKISSTSLEAPKILQSGLEAYGFSITRDNKKMCYTKYIWSSNLSTCVYDKKDLSFNSKKLTEGTSLYDMPAISPDGNKIAYVVRGNIFVMSINGDSVKQLTFFNEGGRNPSWSPDGKEIAFISESKLYSVSSKGGTPSVLIDKVAGYCAVWESNSEIFYHNYGNRNFYIFNPVTKENKMLVSNDSVGWMFTPRLSPDNSKIAVKWNRYSNNKNASGLWLISLKDSSQKLLFKGDAIYPMGWSQNSEVIYAANFDKVPIELLKISAKTKSTKRIYIFPGNIYPWVISHDEATIVCTEHESTSDVWMIENFDPDVE